MNTFFFLVFSLKCFLLCWEGAVDAFNNPELIPTCF